jgi:asparagine synthetase B (glutamine-hydrolysing)
LSTDPPQLDECSEAVAYLEGTLHESLKPRVLNIPDPPLTDTHQQITDRARLAILFSGGLDCTVLARMSHDLLPKDEPIDLLNVAFENPRIHKNLTSDSRNSAFELCPDRITGRASYAELTTVCPGRIWRFVAINVPYSETVQHRHKVISLMYPHNTEMDLSISFALYFAARGVGQVRTTENESVPYTTTARVLLSGLGADELFGGYTRHANAFQHGGLHGLLDELELDVSRLGQRNLGRDDRVMAHWSKEVRFPYLDEHLLSWALNAPVTDKCGFEEQHADTTVMDGAGSDALEPGKKVLRCLAWRLGMKAVAKEKKRAVSRSFALHLHLC